ncbi:hypothetical protein SELMODRAFT_417125 [Selaginella moellendorffii]|uniref:Uncharacterized protein n=1 Tax=Selaginella moellendorffii TaxID=88036 RepID=D8S1G0_SELML|nr:protein SLOW GREEN 1, chloroplastic [Selaginella moellendorffii]EFJ21843.1 hypothetical protein SELMODRAFT_417125 [Selaginella moellendorffii]|eukprot:XP_002977234.1 protein SLOW GREEN 1, chloroplastic [Selaginella moellendorffii]
MEIASSTALALHALGRASRMPLPAAVRSSRRLEISSPGSIRFAAPDSSGRRRSLSRSRPQCSRLPSAVEERSLKDRVRRIAALFLGSSALLLAAGMNSCRVARAEEAIASANENVATTTAVEQKEGAPEKKKTLRRRTQEEEEEILDDLTRLHGFMEKRDMPAAIKVLSKLIDMNPSQLEFRFIRGHAYEYIGDLDNALKEFEDAVKVDPLSLRALQGLALVLKKQGKDIDFIQKIVEDAAAKATEEDRPKDARNFRMLRGQLLTLKEELPQALELYEQLSKEDPTDFRPHVCQGLVCCMLGELDQAEEHFSNFEKYCPQYYEGREAIEELVNRARSDAKQRMEEESSKVATQS